MTDDDTPYLEDLNVRHIRAANEQVDEEMSDLEAKVSDLEDEIATLEDEVDDKDEQIEAYEGVIADFRESRREEYLERIREANEAVSEDEEIDLSAFEDSDPDTLQAVAEQVERLADAARDEPVRNETPDLGNAAGGDGGDDDLEAAKQEVAESVGLGSAYERIQNGDTRKPMSVGNGSRNNSPGDDLRAALDDLARGDD